MIQKIVIKEIEREEALHRKLRNKKKDLILVPNHRDLEADRLQNENATIYFMCLIDFYNWKSYNKLLL